MSPPRFPVRFIRLVDVNGPKRGVDSRCSISADLITGQRLFVDATAAWPVAAIRHAASRLGDAMRRVHKRQAAHRVDSTATLGNARSRGLRFSWLENLDEPEIYAAANIPRPAPAGL